MRVYDVRLRVYARVYVCVCAYLRDVCTLARVVMCARYACVRFQYLLKGIL